MKQKTGVYICMAMAMLVLILDSSCAMAAASEGMDLCIKTVIPALFPFFVLSIYLTGSMGSGSGAVSVLLSGLLGGYPVGTQNAAECYRRGKISYRGANRLLMYCSQAGPSFLFGMAASQFEEAKYGWLLWAVQLLSALTLAITFPVVENRRDPSPQPDISMTKAVKNATQAMVSVCGWVILFRVIIVFLNKWFLWALPDVLRVLTAGMLELSNGCLMVHTIPEVEQRFLVIAVMLNFGGICVLMQTASVIEGLDLRFYIRGKLMQTGLAVLYGLAFMGYFLFLIPIIAFFLIMRRINPGKKGSIPDLIGV